MKRKLNWIIGCTLLCGIVASPIYAQKGVGESEGIARQAVKPEVVALSGTVKGIMIEKCEKTTGPSVRGAHILMTSDDGDEWNIHLGPADDVRHLTDKLVVGKVLSVKAFRTDKLPSDNYVARSLTIDDGTIELRDENLRPVWASGKRGGRGAGRGRGGNGPGWGGGRGPGWENGPGRGGRGGRGAGRGAGRGRGQAIASNDETPLTDDEAEGLIRLREEEQLAHDVYVALRDTWDVPLFSNISQAESRHMMAMARLLDTYDLTDPVDERETGEFDSPAFAKLYDELVKAGSVSLAGAYKVGALIEEMDIADLREAQEDSKRADILGVYANLERASRNHLRAFAAQLDRLDETYAAEHLKQAEFDAIAASDYERGPGAGRGARGNGRGPGWGRGQGRGNAAGGGPGCGRCGQGGPGCGQCGQRGGGGQGRGRGAGRGRGQGRGAGGGNG